MRKPITWRKERTKYITKKRYWWNEIRIWCRKNKSAKSTEFYLTHFIAQILKNKIYIFILSKLLINCVIKKRIIMRTNKSSIRKTSHGFWKPIIKRCKRSPLKNSPPPLKTQPPSSPRQYNFHLNDRIANFLRKKNHVPII